MPGRCATCRHWQHDDHETGYAGEPMGECLLARSSDGYRDNPAAPMYAKDSECYHAHLNTRPDFGCTAHEPIAPPIALTRREIID